jgi:ankyrin repeat protein
MNCVDFDHFLEGIELCSSRADGQEVIKQILISNPAFASYADSDGTTALMILSGCGPTQLVRTLCELGANVNKVSCLGETALINAIRAAAFGMSKDAVSTVQLLLEYGADPNLIARDGCNALHQAIIYSQVGLVEMLLAHGADPLVRLDDPPSIENALELARSGRVRGTRTEKSEIIRLLTQNTKSNKAEVQQINGAPISRPARIIGS